MTFNFIAYAVGHAKIKFCIYNKFFCWNELVLVPDVGKYINGESW